MFEVLVVFINMFLFFQNPSLASCFFSLMQMEYIKSFCANVDQFCSNYIHIFATRMCIQKYNSYIKTSQKSNHLPQISKVGEETKLISNQGPRVTKEKGGKTPKGRNESKLRNNRGLN